MWYLEVPTERFFQGDQRRQVEAIFNAILPGDETAPGATDAGAVEYIDRFLAMDESFYYDIRNWKRSYNNGLKALDAASAHLYGGRPLLELSGEEITDVLDKLSKARLEGMPEGYDQRGFFTMMRNHCIEGCFADPRWGGNKDAIIWRWFGYLYPTTDFRRNESGVTQEVDANANS